MSWTCRLIASPTLDTGPDGLNGFQRLQVGDMWWADMPEDTDHLSMLVCRVKHAGMRPLIVRLPGPADFAIYGPTWRDGVHGPGWDVVGDAPKVTVSPSINLVGVYHGYLRDGVITDDLDGHTYDARGHIVRNGKPG